MMLRASLTTLGKGIKKGTRVPWVKLPFVEFSD